jgi:DNA-binding GntR family transcriptional regulator
MVEELKNRIRSTIINVEFSLGQKLSKSFLQKYLCMSRTPIREVLGQLLVEGIVSYSEYRGFRVFKMDEQELREFYDLRLTFEVKALSDANAKNRLELIKVLKNIIKEMEDSIKYNDFDTYNLKDSEFHKSFILFSSNRFLLKYYENIISINRTYQTRTNKLDRLIYLKKQRSMEGHVEILKQLEKNNLSLVLRNLRMHVNNFSRVSIIPFLVAD